MKMTETKSTEEGLDGLVQQTFRLFELIPYSVLALGARFAVALFFFRSALTRVGEKIDLGFMSIPLPWVIGEHQDLVFSEYKYFGFEMPEWFHAVSVHPIVWAESVFPAAPDGRPGVALCGGGLVRHGADDRPGRL